MVNARSVRVASYITMLGLGFILGMFYFAFVMSGEIYDYEDNFKPQDRPHVDAIVCLAGGRGRIRTAGQWWMELSSSQKGKEPPVFYLSGVGSQAQWSAIKKQLDDSIAQRISESNVLMEAWSLNTSENAWWVLKYAKEKQWRSILLVTSSYHMRRAEFIFEKVLKNRKTGIPGFQIWTATSHQEPFNAEKWNEDSNAIYVTFIEYFKWMYYRMFWKPEQPLGLGL